MHLFVWERYRLMFRHVHINIFPITDIDNTDVEIIIIIIIITTTMSIIMRNLILVITTKVHVSCIAAADKTSTSLFVAF